MPAISGVLLYLIQEWLNYFQYTHPQVARNHAPRPHAEPVP